MDSRKKSWVLAGILSAGILFCAVAHAGVAEQIAEVLRRKMEEQQRQKQQQTMPAPSTGSSNGRGNGCLDLVDRDAASLDSTLRSMEGNPREGATKVVPIMDGRRAVGAAQVLGGAEAVQAVQAVVASEVSLSGKKLQGRVLLPIGTRDLSRGYTRVPGVAILAVLDYRGK